MHTKEYNGFAIKYPGPDLHQEEIESLMYFLHHQIEEINNYSDKSLFFQNPQIIDGWLALVRAIEKIETWEAAEDKTKWEDRTETYVAYLLTLRDFYFKYQKLYKEYYEQLSKILECYGGWLEGECVSAEGIEAFSADHYCDDLEDVDDIIQHLTNLNHDSLNARSAVHSVLTDILGLMMPVMNRGALIITGMNPTIEDFVKAIDDDLREWTFSFWKSMFREMKEDLNRHFKEYRTAPYTPELWGELLASDEEALNLAKRKGLSNCDTAKQEHWGEDMKKQMDENSELMQLIYSSCRTDELFDLRMADNQQQIISLLTPENLSMFYDIIVRRNLIQCEMFPELKNQHEEWLNRANELPNEDEETGMSKARQSKLNEIIEILQKGNWKLPATAENIKQLLNTIFGRDMSLLEDGDEQQCEKMWNLVERGSGNRMEVVPANLAGFFLEENLLNGSPKTISDDLFGKSNNQTNNINKGKGTPSNCSIAFIAVIPFMRKYIDKIIRQA